MSVVYKSPKEAAMNRRTKSESSKRFRLLRKTGLICTTLSPNIYKESGLSILGRVEKKKVDMLAGGGYTSEILPTKFIAARAMGQIGKACPRKALAGDVSLGGRSSRWVPRTQGHESCRQKRCRLLRHQDRQNS
jgi:hypothetical protein